MPIQPVHSAIVLTIDQSLLEVVERQGRLYLRMHRAIAEGETIGKTVAFS